MLKILSSTVSCDSAMKVRDAIEKILGLKSKTILVSKDSGACRGHAVIMRYGCGYGNLQEEPSWNSRDFINLCISKLDFSQRFRGFANVPTFNREIPTEFPVMIRETLTGAKSQGCHVVHTLDEFQRIWEPTFYWTKFFSDKEFEIRVLMVLHDKGFELRIYKKVPVDGKENSEDFIVEGDNTMWKLRKPSHYPKVIEIAKKMAKTIWTSGGRFVGIDMIYVPSLKDYVVLEFNSGPWLTKGAAEWLASIFVNTDEWKKNFAGKEK